MESDPPFPDVVDPEIEDEQQRFLVAQMPPKKVSIANKFECDCSPEIDHKQFDDDDDATPVPVPAPPPISVLTALIKGRSSRSRASSMINTRSHSPLFRPDSNFPFDQTANNSECGTPNTSASLCSGLGQSASCSPYYTASTDFLSTLSVSNSSLSSSSNAVTNTCTTSIPSASVAPRTSTSKPLPIPVPRSSGGAKRGSKNDENPFFATLKNAIVARQSTETKTRVGQYDSSALPSSSGTSIPPPPPLRRSGQLERPRELVHYFKPAVAQPRKRSAVRPAFRASAASVCVSEVTHNTTTARSQLPLPPPSRRKATIASSHSRRRSASVGDNFEMSMLCNEVAAPNYTAQLSKTRKEANDFVPSSVSSAPSTPLVTKKNLQPSRSANSFVTKTSDSVDVCEHSQQEELMMPPPTSNIIKTEADSTTMSTIDLNTVFFSGWMMKEGDFIRSWKKRFFLLRGDCLQYYADENVKETKPKGTILLSENNNSSSIVSISPFQKRSSCGRSCLELVTKNRKWHFYAENDVDNKGWFASIFNRLLFLGYYNRSQMATLPVDHRLCAFLNHPNQHSNLISYLQKYVESPQLMSLVAKQSRLFPFASCLDPLAVRVTTSASFSSSSSVSTSSSATIMPSANIVIVPLLGQLQKALEEKTCTNASSSSSCSSSASSSQALSSTSRSTSASCCLNKYSSSLYTSSSTVEVVSLQNIDEVIVSIPFSDHTTKVEKFAVLPHPSALKLCNQPLHTLTIEVLSTVLSTPVCRTISQLELVNCSLTAEDLDVLFKAILSNRVSTIRAINFSNNPISSFASSSISASSSASLDKTSSPFATLMRLLLARPHITEINASGCEIDDACIFAMATAAADCQESSMHVSALKLLNLSRNKITSAGIEHFVAFWPRVFPSLFQLHLEGNMLDSKGAVALSTVLASSTQTLQLLNLKQNKVGDDGAIAIACALKKNTRLTSLDLSTNAAISDSGQRALAHVAQLNDTLLYLAFGNFQLSSPVFTAMRLLCRFGFASSVVDSTLADSQQTQSKQQATQKL